ncbi:MAG: hypothetical protein K0S54_754 [Alphaproteobacteria bacterium]|jgi:hypothetical protein|nr:hypothetical protein [Alphaproteobacteria bacterium]
MRALLVAGVLLLAGTAQAVACQMPVLEAARTLTDDKGFALAWRFVPAQPKIGEFFAVEFAVCNRAGSATPETLRVDATMPAHRHGMNFQPKIAAIGPNTYRAEGMMFHMPGKWQLVFEQRAPAPSVRVTTDIEIE